MAFSSVLAQRTGNAHLAWQLDLLHALGLSTDSVPKLQGGGQQDAHELLRALLEGLEAEQDAALRCAAEADAAAAEAGLQVRPLAMDPAAASNALEHIGS